MKKKKEGRYQSRSMTRFSDFINANKLLDLPLMGRRFTWSNNQERVVMSRINRFLLKNGMGSLHGISKMCFQGWFQNIARSSYFQILRIGVLNRSDHRCQFRSVQACSSWNVPEFFKSGTE